MSQLSDEDLAESHRKRPTSGWLALTQNPSVAYIIDALLDFPSRREFNQTELADHAGVSRKSVARHIRSLESYGIITRVPNTSPTRYRFAAESEIGQAITKVDGAMNAAGPSTESNDDS